MELRCVNCKEALKFTVVEDGFDYLVKECAKCFGAWDMRVLTFASSLQLRLSTIRSVPFISNQQCFNRIERETQSLLDAIVNHRPSKEIELSAASVAFFLMLLCENNKC